MSRERPVVFAVLSHRDPDQVERLCDRLLQDPRARVLLHHDASSRDPLTPSLLSRDRVAVVASPRSLQWGKPDDILAFTDLLRSATACDPAWIVMLSGQDYPLLPPPALIDCLDASGADLHMDVKRADGDPGWPPGEATRRYGYCYVRLSRLPHRVRRLLTRIARVLPAPLFSSIEWEAETFLGVRRRNGEMDRFPLYSGSQWFAVRGRTAHAMLAFIDGHQGFTRSMLRTALPDEVYFQTVAMQLPEVTIGRQLHGVRFDGARAAPVRIAELAAHVADGALFVRKVDLDAEPGLLEAIHVLGAHEPVTAGR